MTTPASISEGLSVISSPSIVGEDGTLFISFWMPLPLETGCKFKFTFPPNINLQNASLTTYWGFQMFSTSALNDLSVNHVTREVTLNSLCISYVANS